MREELLEKLMAMVRPLFKRAWQKFVEKKVLEKGTGVSVEYLEGLRDGYWGGVSDATRIGMQVSTMIPSSHRSEIQANRPN